MTFFHFINCMALTYAPYFITYKYSGLSEYSSVWKCAQAGMGYFMTQLSKLLILATFFPASEYEGERFDLAGEVMKGTIDVLDWLGMYLIIFWSLAGKGEVKFLAAGLGWAAADCIATRLVPYWVGARGLGFDWKYIHMGLDSNLNLVHFMSFAALVWMWKRNDLQLRLKQTAFGLLIYAGYRNLIFELLLQTFGMSSWGLIVIKSVVTTAVAISTMVMYQSLGGHREYNSR